MHRLFLLPPTQNTPTSKWTSSGSLGSSLLALFKLPRLDTFVPHSWCRPPIPTLSFAFSHSGFFPPSTNPSSIHALPVEKSTSAQTLPFTSICPSIYLISNVTNNNAKASTKAYPGSANLSFHLLISFLHLSIMQGCSWTSKYVVTLNGHN
jgi:hypothetical protein